MERSQVFQEGNWIAAATTASAEAQPWPTSKLLPLVVLLSVAYVIASLCLTNMLGSPADDIFFIEDIAMFALLLVFWLIAQPLLTRHTKKLGVISKQSAEEVDDFPTPREALPSHTRGYAVFRARRAQRRRRLRCGVEQLREVVRSLSDAAASIAASACTAGGSQAKRLTASQQTIHNFHITPRSVGLLPTEVAVSHYPPDVCEHVRRHLEDKWAVVESAGSDKRLPSIPE